jgi:PAS domain-containing protein
MHARMVPSTPDNADEPGAPAFLDEALLVRLESIPEPAAIYLPGGRVAAVNRVAARLSGFRGGTTTFGELNERYEARRDDGSPLPPGDTPSVRALRGEVVTHGERIDVTLPDGSVYRAVVTSSPIIVDGKVVAALEVWHDFDAYARGLAGEPVPPGHPSVSGTLPTSSTTRPSRSRTSRPK